jgi:hypothetical protein
MTLHLALIAIGATNIGTFCLGCLITLHLTRTPAQVDRAQHHGYRRGITHAHLDRDLADITRSNT